MKFVMSDFGEPRTDTVLCYHKIQISVIIDWSFIEQCSQRYGSVSSVISCMQKIKGYEIYYNIQSFHIVIEMIPAFGNKIAFLFFRYFSWNAKELIIESLRNWNC